MSPHNIRVSPFHARHIMSACIREAMEHFGYDIHAQLAVINRFSDITVDDSPYSYDARVVMMFLLNGMPYELAVECSYKSTRDDNNEGKATAILKAAIVKVDPLVWLALSI